MILNDDIDRHIWKALAEFARRRVDVLWRLNFLLILLTPEQIKY